jgi:ribosomal protein RSM22 (predicted rRNA methylase)
MTETFINLPQPIVDAIQTVLGRQSTADWVFRAAALHERYMQRKKNSAGKYISDQTDALSYIALRTPATYAQIVGALATVKELLPEWQPKTVLDVGSGPGTGIWATTSLWPSITAATAIDQDNNLLLLGKEILTTAGLSVDISWKNQDIRKNIADDSSYDVVILANILNELSVSEGEKLLGNCFNRCAGVLIIIEPGTPFGAGIAVSVAKKLSKAGIVLAPYVHHTIIADEEHWLHFSQRFIRPDFLRRLRQHMRETSSMASDWEDAKYAYVAVSKFSSEIAAWGRCAGPVRILKGFLTVPVLTKEGIVSIKVLKRDKERYQRAKELRWGEVLLEVL